MSIQENYPVNLYVKYNYICVDNMYVVTLAVIKYDAKIEMLNTFNDIIRIDELEISFHYARQNSSELLKQLTGIIARSSSEIGTVSKNQIDLNVMENMKNQAIDLRKKIQIDGEQIYTLNTYILLKDKNLNSLMERTKKVS